MKIFLITAIFLLSIQTIYAHDVCNSTLENNTNMLPEGYCSISLGLQTDKTEYKNQEKITIYNILTFSFLFRENGNIEGLKEQILYKISLDFSDNVKLKHYSP